MAFDFPAAPAVGDKYQDPTSGTEYVWTGTTWDLSSGGDLQDYVLKVGDTMTGTLTLSADAAANINLQPGGGQYSGRIEFHDNAGVRRGYLGRLDSAAAAPLNLVFEGGTRGLHIAGGGLSWGTDTVAASQHDFSKGICIYGYGTTSQFGWNITSGTLNHIVQSASNKHNFVVGTENKLEIKSTGLFTPTVSNDKNGYFIGDRYHGMYFHGGNTLVFTEYHDRFEWRRQTSGTSGGAGDLRMSLIGGALTINAPQHINIVTDGYGIKFNGNAHIYKKVGEGGLLREAGGDYRWAIEGNTGTWKGWISYQASATLSVEELIEERVLPLRTELDALRAEIAELKARMK